MWNSWLSNNKNLRGLADDISISPDLPQFLRPIKTQLLTKRKSFNPGDKRKALLKYLRQRPYNVLAVGKVKLMHWRQYAPDYQLMQLYLYLDRPRTFCLWDSMKQILFYMAPQCPLVPIKICCFILFPSRFVIRTDLPLLSWFFTKCFIFYVWYVHKLFVYCLDSSYMLYRETMYFLRSPSVIWNWVISLPLCVFVLR